MSQTPPDMKIRLSAELRRQVEEAARQNNRTLNSEIVSRLEMSFAGALGGDDLGQRVKTLERELETLQKQMRWLENEWGQRLK